MNIKNISRKLIIIGCVLGMAIFLLWIFGHLEMFCYIYPAIDTTFADKYTEEGFDNIKIEMTVNEVRQLIGDPLNIVYNKDGSETWWYSEDGKCKFWGDFAWLGRAIIFKEDKVVTIEKRIYYD